MVATLRRSYERVRHASPLYRFFLVTGAMVVVVAIVALATAAKTPSATPNSATWHTSKVSRMSEVRAGHSRELRASSEEPSFPARDTTEARRVPPQLEATLGLASPAFAVPQFRSPPTLLS
jgi:hypothetical protein